MGVINVKDRLGSKKNSIVIKEGKWDYLDNLKAEEIRNELLKERKNEGEGNDKNNLMVE